MWWSQRSLTSVPGHRTLGTGNGHRTTSWTGPTAGALRWKSPKRWATGSIRMRTPASGMGPRLVSGHRSLSLSHGDMDKLVETVERKMKDKAEHRQLEGHGNAEKWLAIYLDQDAGSQLELLMEPVTGIVLEVPPGGLARPACVYEEARMPCFDVLLGYARTCGYDQVWCLTQSVRGIGRTLVLRLTVEADLWECFSVLDSYRFEGGGISTPAPLLGRPTTGPIASA